MKSIKAKGEKERRCYTYIAKYVMGGILSIIGFVLMLSPGLIPAKIPVEKSLPQAQLEYFSDSFGTFQEVLREKPTVHLPKIIKEGSFQPGEIITSDRRLEIMTKPDSFSKVVIALKFRFKGDFDIRDFESDVRSLTRNLGVSERVTFDKTDLHDLRLDGSKKAVTNCSEFNLLISAIVSSMLIVWNLSI